MTLLEQDGIRYELLSTENLDATCRCVAEAFTTSEPLTIKQQITLEEHMAFCKVFLTKAMNEGLSIVAIDTEIQDPTARVIGARISEDLFTPPPPEAEDLTPKFGPIFDILDGLSARWKAANQNRKGKAVHMFMVAVRKPYRKRGVAPTMNKLAFPMWLEKGYTHAVTEATGVISQHILQNKFHFHFREQADYDTYVFPETGEKPFADVPKEMGTCTRLLEKEIAELVKEQSGDS